jgi:hypothetical protein
MKSQMCRKCISSSALGIDSLVKQLGYVDEANFAMDVNLGDDHRQALAILVGLLFQRHKRSVSIAYIAIPI